MCCRQAAQSPYETPSPPPAFQTHPLSNNIAWYLWGIYCTGGVSQTSHQANCKRQSDQMALVLGLLMYPTDIS